MSHKHNGENRDYYVGHDNDNYIGEKFLTSTSNGSNGIFENSFNLNILDSKTANRLLKKERKDKAAKAKKHKQRDKEIILTSCRPPNNSNTSALPVIEKITPKTKTQEYFFASYWDNKSLFSDSKHFLVHGYAGTGKSFCSLYLALKELLYDKNCPYKKIIIIRSAVPSREIGFLPGSLEEKTQIFEEPYKEICNELLGTAKGYEILKSRFLLEFTTSSYLRGLSFNDAIVIVDEIQNATEQELDTIITRAGINCKMIFCGDIRQTDLNKKYEKSGAPAFMKILEKMPSFIKIEFQIADIVRSPIVKEYILAKCEVNDYKSEEQDDKSLDVLPNFIKSKI